MNSPKFLQQGIRVILVVVFLAGCATPAATPTQRPTFPPPPPSPTPAQPQQSTGQLTLFKLVRTVAVTPAGNLLEGGFVRIGYVPGRGRIIVTFNTKLSQPEGGCVDQGYAYKEYTTDMVETGNAGVVSCHAFSDTGGLFAGDDFYLASMEHQNDVDGWQLAKYNAVTWTSLASRYQPMSTGEDPGDPMLAIVNGQLDVSSTYRADPNATRGPLVSAATFHDFFTTDLQFVSKRVLSDTPHINLSSMVTAGGVINFLSGTALLGDLIVMRYDPSWNYLGTKTLKQKSSAPEGVAFDGKRFYVSYLDVPCAGVPCLGNVHLAAFDSSWNLLDDIAVTSFTLQDNNWPARPSLALRNGRLYVGYDECDQCPATGPLGHPQAYVKVYDVSGE